MHRGDRTIIDYHVERTRAPARRRLRWPALAILVCGGVALLGLAPQSRGTSSERVTLPLELPAAAPQPVPARAAPAPGATEAGGERPAVPLTETAPVAAEPLERKSVTIGQGESLYYIFKKHKLDPAELMLLLKSREHGRKLERVMPGQVLEFTLDDSRSVQALALVLDQTRTIHYSRDADGFNSALVETPLERRTAHADGQIENSLFLAGQRAGLSNKLIMEMVEIFAWDIDFALDIRSGDSFLVIYEELFKDGEKIADGNVLAAEFVNQGKRFRAVRYVDPNDRAAYFAPDGMSMRKAFLRTPVKFGRVSSRFNLKRRHPILHRIRAHRGVDYAAPPGTPIRATGDGKVVFVGRKGGYGRTVILRHGSTYTTLYAHMRSYARGIRTGKRVQQGQVIGYVGSSGLASGPHLHYEFRVRGVHRNPLTVQLPKAAPIPDELMSDFVTKTRQLVTQLEVLSRTRVALSD